jgi:hypothetical protein
VLTIIGIRRIIKNLYLLYANRLRNRKAILTQNRTGVDGPLGAAYLRDFAYESPYDSVYDLLHKVVCNLIFNRCFLKCVDKQL